MSPPAVLDASAVMALLLKEPGGEVVAPYVGVGSLSVVNYSEIVARLSDRGASADFIDAQLDALGLTILAFDRDIARAAGLLRPVTKERGLSFADRACLATAMLRRARVVTADREWAELDLDLAIELIR